MYSPAYCDLTGSVFGMKTKKPRNSATLVQWADSCGVQLQPQLDALERNILSRNVFHPNETPVQMLKPVKGKTLTTSVVTRNA